MSETKARNTLAIAAATLATGVLAYVVYFDYKRRNDAQFRRKLRKEKKRIDKTVAQEKDSAPSGTPGPSGNITTEMLRVVLDEVKKEDPPTTTDGKEAYFMTQVGMGEQLATQGPAFYLPAATAFYKALRVYPNPVELIVIYQKTIPEPLFKIVVDLMNLDVVIKAAGYFDHFPPKSMNVQVKPNEQGRNVLLVTKDIAAGETIYKEFPVVAVLDADLESAGKHCSHCFRPLEQAQVSDPILHPSEYNPLGSAYCSKHCLTTNKIQSSSLLFSQKPVLPPLLAPPSSPALDIEGRKTAQENFVEYLEREERSSPLLLARFIARQIAIETAKLIAKVSPTNPDADQREGEDYTDAEGVEVTLAEHMERLRLFEVKPKEEELRLISAVFEKTLPGLEEFITEERHLVLLGKVIYNAIGVGSRNDKPEPTARPEDVEKSRTSVGTQRQLGSAIYSLSPYANHSCSPNAKFTFPTGTTELHVVATKGMKKGDELTVSYVDVDQREFESNIDARRRRRVELARGWRFACGCEKCEEEAKGLSQEEKSEGVGVEGVKEGEDQSKVSESPKML